MMTDQDSISILKRKIIGVNKLVKDKNKTDAKNAELNAAIDQKSKIISEKDSEIAKLKVGVMTKPVQTEGQLSKLEKDLEETRKILEEKTMKVAKYREESQRGSQKIGQLEIDLGKRNGRVAALEKDLLKKNSDIIEREIESQELKKQLEDIESSKKVLEENIASGRHVESLKKAYDDIKWQNLAEISSLKQEKAAFEKRISEMNETNDVLSKKNQELDKSAESDSKKFKANESFEKVIEKKDKVIVNLEKKLEKAFKDNDKLKARLSKKGIQSGDDFKDDITDRGSESEMDVSDAPLAEEETELVPPPRKAFSFPSFSKPNARFSICKPNFSNKRRAIVPFKKYSSLKENLPVVFNLSPSISDSFPSLNPCPSNVKPSKRKLDEETLKTPTSKKKLKLSHSNHYIVPDSTSPPQMSSLHSSTQVSSLNSNSLISAMEPFSLPMVPTPLNHSTPVSHPTSSHTFPLPLPPTSSGYTNPNPTKARHARSTKSGIAPLKHLTKQLSTPKFEKVEKISNIKLKIVPPISPIKSPKVQLPTNPSQTAPNSARAKILASSLGPIAVEAQVKVVGGKLNQAQLEAAKRRSIPSVTHLPSVNGFRQSANELKAASKVTSTGKASNCTTGQTKSGKADLKQQNTSEELLYCPSRRRTNPLKVSASSSNNVSQQSDAFCLVDKSTDVAKGGQSIEDSSKNSENSHTTPIKVVTPDNISAKSVTSNGSRFKSKEFLSTEESSDDELTVDTPKIDPDKKSVVSFDHISLNNSSHEVITPMKLNSVDVQRSESLDEDLDISDSDDDNRDEISHLTDKPDQDTTELTPVISSKRKDSTISFTNIKQSETIAPSGDNSDRNQEKRLSQDSDAESNRSSERFDRLRSENKKTPENQVNVEVKKEYLEDEEKLKEKPASENLPVTVKKRTFFSQLDELMYHFKSRTDESIKKLQFERDKLSKERSSFAYEAYVDCIKKHFKNMMGSQNEESFGKLVDGIASNSNPQNEVIVCDLVYEYLKSEHRDSPLLNATDENQPAITRKQQRLFVVLTMLAEKPRYKFIIDRMLNLLWHNLFGRDRMFNLKLNAVQNSGRMFVLCARYTDSVSLMKHFIYDLFYFKSPRNHILIGIVIALWPDIFCYASSPLSHTPLGESIAWCIFNTGPAQKSPEMLVQETKDNFVREYGYKANAVKADGLVLKFIKLAEERCQNKELLEEITMCLLLIGRSKEFRWVNNNISARLLKSLANVWGEGGDQAVLRWVITTLGLLSRVYPAEGRDQVKTLYTSVEQLLLKGSILQPETELCCINALLHLGYHLQSQVAVFFKTWHPSHPVDARTRQMLEDFVGTRGKKHAEITAKVMRIEYTKQRKRKGLKNNS